VSASGFSAPYRYETIDAVEDCFASRHVSFFGRVSIRESLNVGGLAQQPVACRAMGGWEIVSTALG
jgi:hypothetical protein